MAAWRKKGVFAFVLLISLLPFFIAYSAAKPDVVEIFWQLRHFLWAAAMQAIAQVAIAWYLLRNKVPQYVVLGFLSMVMLFQLTFGISVTLLSIARSCAAGSSLFIAVRH